MGLIKALTTAVSGGLADQWLEVFEPDDMGGQTVFTRGVLVRRGQNTKGSENTVSNGSVIHVYENQMMMLVDGGKIVDYSAEPGYYTVDKSTMPSLLNGEFKDTLMESLNRIRFGGETSTMQKVYYINLQEIKGIKFGTRNPISYLDPVLGLELFFRAHGTYSIKITNPITFYREAVPKNVDRVDIDDINEQYLSEFLSSFQAAVNRLSEDGVRAASVISKGPDIQKYMAEILDADWDQMRGMQIQSVGVANITYDEESRELIAMRNKGAAFSDATIREGYMQANVAEGLKAAGSNANGAMAGFMGVGMGAQMGGGMMGTASQTNLQQMQMQQQMQAQQQQMQPQAPVASGWACSCGASNNVGKFCSSCGKPEPAPEPENGWTCECGTKNTGKFCGNCGKPQPVKQSGWVCECGTQNEGKFCGNCGKPKPEDNGKWVCKCGTENEGKFCGNCGSPKE